ncbi:hypothetical protein COCSUDRAFT_42545 [Coccomyxa subellipsoidea C-169]|uniref:Uncharacterized protein n=1 Tax=Coccomyxa subellipsoidea (strain C-169) TaxID=574566 RepID=I0YUU6_COCSC|nr:hypothetical protein COCSUDRAFT_42545 [Coccomyxa subellipsoidea C-169]EIE22165.1 hypothetical protein COCSUDRAFT_42545 [Coccomyxa subellipsoidea C-169]|eukprot:XP_005646709.1 hypothetical protein COCSUDRAFT_42545 [Coccomyxa subellipsoidea C-169]
MAFPEFEVPLTPQDLPAEQTYEMVNASLTALQEASDGVFNRIQDAVEERKGTSKNSLQLPGRDLPPPPELPAEDDGRVRGQDTADLLHFFKQAQATSSAITTQAQASRRVADRPSPPQPFSFQELPFPALQLPRTLPDLEASSQRSSAKSGNGRPEPSRPRVPWDPAFTGRQISQESRSSRALSEDGEPSAKPKQAEQTKSPTVNGRTKEEAAEPEETTCSDELAADMGKRTDAFAAATSGKRPPRSLPPSRGGSAEALDTQGGGPTQSQLRLGVPPPFLEGPGSVGSQRRFAHMGDLGTALDKHVDLGALGGVPSDLEQSILMRQRSLSSRASMDDPTH